MWPHSKARRETIRVYVSISVHSWLNFNSTRSAALRLEGRIGWVRLWNRVLAITRLWGDKGCEFEFVLDAASKMG